MKIANPRIIVLLSCLSIFFWIILIKITDDQKQKHFGLPQAKETYQKLYRYEYGDTNGFKGALQLIDETRLQIDILESAGEPQEADRFKPILQEFNHILFNITNTMGELVIRYGEEVTKP